MRIPVLLLVVSLLVGCEARVAELSSADLELLQAVHITEALGLRILEQGVAIERLMALTEEYDQVPAEGIVLLTKQNQGRRVLPELRSIVAGTGFRAYVLDDGFGHGPDKLAIARVQSDREFLAIVRPDGINYDIDHEQVMSKYACWESEYSLGLVGAGNDWVEAAIGEPPKSWDSFAQEVFEFCPDVVEQGTGSVEALSSEMRRESRLYLWWD